ncbi:MAG TPA: hypothetical protein VFV52_10250 [Bacilli bacterium]|nr:hypothetical protein [Bacilli bacterium]
MEINAYKCDMKKLLGEWERVDEYVHACHEFKEDEDGSDAVARLANLSERGAEILATLANMTFSTAPPTALKEFIEEVVTLQMEAIGHAVQAIEHAANEDVPASEASMEKYRAVDADIFERVRWLYFVAGTSRAMLFGEQEVL